MADVVVQRRTEGLDLLPAHVHLVRADPELEEAVGEVPDEEDHRVAYEPDGRGPHDPGSDPQATVCPSGDGGLRCQRRHPYPPPSPATTRKSSSRLQFPG